jgi:hypothetical protein
VASGPCRAAATRGTFDVDAASFARLGPAAAVVQWVGTLTAAFLPVFEWVEACK